MPQIRSIWSMVACVLALAVVFPAQAGMQQRAVEWQVEAADYSGILLYDATDSAQRPGVVLVPNWRGITPSAIQQAHAIAANGYVVLLADVYGKAIRPAGTAEAAAAVQPLLADRHVLRTRATAALEALRAQADTTPLDATRIAAVGFCFGGSTVLEMVRAGLPLAAIVSLHGGLATPLPTAGQISTSILVLNGAADSAVSQDDVVRFGEEMTRAGADWQLVNFGGAVHCFAEAEADSPPNCLYHPKAGPRAWRWMEDFLHEAFAQ